MLVADVQALEVLAHHDQVDVVEAAARNQGARRAQVGVELELLAQPHVGRAVAAAGAASPAGPSARAACGGCCPAWPWAAGRPRPCTPARPATCRSQSNGRLQRVQRRQRGVDDLRADAVAGNQRGGNLLQGHGGIARRRDAQLTAARGAGRARPWLRARRFRQPPRHFSYAPMGRAAPRVWHLQLPNRRFICHAATSPHTPTSKNGRPSTSRKATRSAASPRTRPSGAPGPR